MIQEQNSTSYQWVERRFNVVSKLVKLHIDMIKRLECVEGRTRK
jgi:hypothetical protein